MPEQTTTNPADESTACRALLRAITQAAEDGRGADAFALAQAYKALTSI